MPRSEVTLALEREKWISEPGLALTTGDSPPIPTTHSDLSSRAVHEIGL